MTRKELLKLVEKIEKARINEELYYRPGLDDVSRMFLYSIKENLHHKNRKEKFKDYTGYQQRY